MAKSGKEFDDVATNVMQSGLLRLLKRSSAQNADADDWRANGDEPIIEVIVEQPPSTKGDQARGAEPPVSASSTATATVAAQQVTTGVVQTTPKRRSPVMIAAWALGVSAVAASAWMYVVHLHHPPDQPVPAQTSTDVVSAPAVPAPEPPVAAAALPAAPQVSATPVEQPRPRVHTHHKHARREQRTK